MNQQNTYRKPAAGPAPGGASSSRTSQKLVGRLAEKYGVPADALLACLRDTAFKVKKEEQPFSDTELAAALIIAEQHDLNPFAREIYVTRSRGKLLVIVPIDGWAKIVNRDPNYDGCEFDVVLDEEGRAESITCRMFRKDRSHPTEITEYAQECQRDTEPWKGWPSRMLRHKAFIQAARYAFALGGMIDDDDAGRILDAEAAPVDEQATDRRRRELPAPRPAASLWDGPAAREPEMVPASGPSLEEELAAAAPTPPEEDGPPPEAPAAAPSSPAPAPASTPTYAQAEAWAEWSAARGKLDAAGLARCKAAAGVDSLTSRSSVEALRAAVACARDLGR